MSIHGWLKVIKVLSYLGVFFISSFDVNPMERHTFWTLIIGGGMTTLTVYAGNQAMVQRYLSMETVKKAQM